MTGNGESRARGPGSQGFGSPTKSTDDITPAKGTTVAAMLPRGTVTGCSCGCTSRPPYIDDPDCVRHRPAPEPREWPSYDVETLGLVPHDRDNCAACQAVGA